MNKSQLATSWGDQFHGFQISLNRRTNRFNNSYIAEVVLYSRNLDDCEFYDVYKYLLDKYGFGEAIPEEANAINYIYGFLEENGLGIDGTNAGDYIRIDGSDDNNVPGVNGNGGNDFVYIKDWGELKIQL